MNSSTQASSVFDVLVVGAGHAGIEAALAASRMGCSVAFFKFARSPQGLFLSRSYP